MVLLLYWCDLLSVVHLLSTGLITSYSIVFSKLSCQDMVAALLLNRNLVALTVLNVGNVTASFLAGFQNLVPYSFVVSWDVKLACHAMPLWNGNLRVCMRTLCRCCQRLTLTPACQTQHSLRAGRSRPACLRNP